MENEELKVEEYVTEGNKKFVVALYSMGFSVHVMLHNETGKSWEASSLNSDRPHKVIYAYSWSRC